MNRSRRHERTPDASSVYFFWSYHSPSKGVYDFETSGKNIQRLFDYAKEAGLWVIARAGPYCNVRDPLMVIELKFRLKRN